MRKFAFVVILFSMILGLSSQSFAAAKSLSGCTARMKNVIQALELWANDHKNSFPSAAEYASDEFNKYLKKSDPATSVKNLVCPDSGEKFVYEVLSGGKSFALRCPEPGCYGLSAYYYTRDKGFVKGTPVPVTDAAAKQKGKTPAEAKKDVKDIKKPSKQPVAQAKPAAQPKAEDKKPAQKPAAKPADTKKPEKQQPSAPVKVSVKELTEQDKEEIVTVIKALYNAYAEKDLDKVLELQKRSIESSALDYEKQGKGSAQDVRDAFREATEEILNHKAFKMLPLNLTDLTFQRKGDLCRVTSVVPIIATDRLEVMEDGKYFFVRLRIGEFIFAPEGDGWVIETMYLY